MQLAGHERPVKVLVLGWAQAGSSPRAALGRARRCCTRPPRKRLRLHPRQGSPLALCSLGCFSSLPKTETSTRPVVFSICVTQHCLTPSHSPRCGIEGLTPRRGSPWVSWGRRSKAKQRTGLFPRAGFSLPQCGAVGWPSEAGGCAGTPGSACHLVAAASPPRAFPWGHGQPWLPGGHLPPATTTRGAWGL